MKRFTILTIALLIGLFSYNAYSLTNFWYNGISIDGSGQIQPNATVDVRITISNSGGTLYQETHTGVSTDQFGGFNVEVGGGTVVTPGLGAITVTADTRITAETNLGGAGWVLTGIAGVAQAMNESLTVLSNAANNASSGDLIYYDGGNWVAKAATVQSSTTGTTMDIRQPALGIYHCIALQGIYPSRSISDPFIGLIIEVGFNFAPLGWAHCDGQLLAISSNTALFSLIGTTFGGNGISTFAIPDLRGRAAIHPGQGSGLSSYTWGQRWGAESRSIPSHSHTISYD